MRSVPAFLLKLALYPAILSLTGVFANAQLDREYFQKLLLDKAVLSQADVSTIEKGETFVKILPSKEKSEIYVFGIVRLGDVPQLDMAVFRESLSQRSNKMMLDGGQFSTPPVFSDLDLLKVEARDIEDIKKCSLGSCAVKLSAFMLNALQTEVDWNAPDHKVRAADLYKKLLVDYGKAYLERGDAALVEYVDRRKPLNLFEEYRILLEASGFIRGLAPELEDHLRKFPRTKLAGAEDRLDWSNVHSGLKPIITITHGTSFSKSSSDSLLLMTTTKQIYANHYVDASLALTSVVRFGTGPSAETYLIFTDISRSDSLGGAFSGVAHAVVEREAVEKVKELLERGKLRLEAKTRDLDKPAADSIDTGWYVWFIDLSRNIFFQIFAVVSLTLLAIFVFRKRRG